MVAAERRLQREGPWERAGDDRSARHPPDGASVSKRRRSSGSRRVAEAKFWGPPPATGPGDQASADEAGATPPPPESEILIRPTPDPGALVRSLGAPPLAVDGGTAERHLTAVYEEAVRAATALAAANGLLGTDTDEA
jgi:hypothetical protein